MVTAALILAAVLFLWWPATQVLRGVVDARRVRETGLGGTQDIAMWATGIGCLLTIATAVVMYLAAGSLRERLGQ